MAKSIAASTRVLAASVSSGFAFEVRASSSTPPSTSAVASTASVVPTISMTPIGSSAPRLAPKPRKRWRISGCPPRSWVHAAARNPTVNTGRSSIIASGPANGMTLTSN